MLRRLLDQVLEGLSYIVLRGFFRTVEVVGLERVPRGRPVLVVANHFYGFVDPVLLIHTLGRVPRFLAKASLWRRTVVRPFLALAGLVPVGRGDDHGRRAARGDGHGDGGGDGTSGHGDGDARRAVHAGAHAGDPRDEAHRARTAAAFARSARVLARNGLVALFPEGTTHDTPRLAPLRTGAARIALHARAAGVRDLMILPVGLVYDDKMALRSRALARFVESIDVDATLPTLDAGDERALARQLTAMIQQRLRAVSPDYHDLRQAAVLSRAAEIALRGRRGRDGVVPLADRDGLAQRLAHAPAAVTDRLIDAVGRYVLDLDVMGLRDHHLVSTVSQRALLGALLTTMAQVVLLAPLALIGLVVNTLPYLLTQAAGRAAAAPVSKGTTRMLVALAVFPATWLTAAWIVTQISGRGWLAAAGVVLLSAVAGLATVHSLERTIRLARAWRARTALRDRRALLSEVRADRERVVAAVTAAVATLGDSATLADDRRGHEDGGPDGRGSRPADPAGGDAAAGAGGDAASALT